MTHSFTDAYKKLQAIHQRISSNEILDVDEISELQKQAEEYYTICSAALQKHTDTQPPTQEKSPLLSTDTDEWWK